VGHARADEIRDGVARAAVPRQPLSSQCEVNDSCSPVAKGTGRTISIDMTDQRKEEDGEKRALNVPPIKAAKISSNEDKQPVAHVDRDESFGYYDVSGDPLMPPSISCDLQDGVALNGSFVTVHVEPVCKDDDMESLKSATGEAGLESPASTSRPRPSVSDERIVIKRKRGSSPFTIDIQPMTRRGDCDCSCHGGRVKRPLTLLTSCDCSFDPQCRSCQDAIDS